MSVQTNLYLKSTIEPHYIIYVTLKAFGIDPGDQIFNLDKFAQHSGAFQLIDVSPDYPDHVSLYFDSDSFIGPVWVLSIPYTKSDGIARFREIANTFSGILVPKDCEPDAAEIIWGNTGDASYTALKNLLNGLKVQK